MLGFSLPFAGRSRAVAALGDYLAARGVSQEARGIIANVFMGHEDYLDRVAGALGWVVPSPWFDSGSLGQFRGFVGGAEERAAEWGAQLDANPDLLAAALDVQRRIQAEGEADHRSMRRIAGTIVGGVAATMISGIAQQSADLAAVNATLPAPETYEAGWGVGSGTATDASPALVAAATAATPATQSLWSRILAWAGNRPTTTRQPTPLQGVAPAVSYRQPTATQYGAAASYYRPAPAYAAAAGYRPPVTVGGVTFAPQLAAAPPMAVPRATGFWSSAFRLFPARVEAGRIRPVTSIWGMF